MKIESWLKDNSSRLNSLGVKTGRLDCMILLEDVLAKDRSHILAHQNYNLTKSQLTILNKYIVQRSSHVPLSQIRHKAYFYNNEFYIDQNVLSPRPESEEIIETLRELSPPVDSAIIDIGTGSGILAITAKLLFPKSHIIATDISPKCLKVAENNARILKVNVVFLKSDLLQSVKIHMNSKTILLANLPYVPNDYKINLSAQFEPKLAIFGGQDGLDLYRRLFDQIQDLNMKPSLIITESLPNQHMRLDTIAKSAGYRLERSRDFTQSYIR